MNDHPAHDTEFIFFDPVFPGLPCGDIEVRLAPNEFTQLDGQWQIEIRQPDHDLIVLDPSRVDAFCATLQAAKDEAGRRR